MQFLYKIKLLLQSQLPSSKFAVPWRFTFWSRKKFWEPVTPWCIDSLWHLEEPYNGISSPGWRHGWVIQLLPSAAAVLLHRKWLGRIFAACIVCLSHSHTFLNQCRTFSTDVRQITSCYFLSESLHTTTYAKHLQAKHQAMQDFIHTNLAKSAEQQKRKYDHHTSFHSFNPGDPVWLSVPTARKLQPHWDGKWTVSKLKGPELTDGHQSKVVHVNHVRHQIQSDQVKGHSITEQQPLQWNPPDFQHLVYSRSSCWWHTTLLPTLWLTPPDWLRFNAWRQDLERRGVCNELVLY